MKKLRNVFALLLALSMVMSLMSVTVFAEGKPSDIQVVEKGGKTYYLADPQEGDVAGPTNFDVWTSKTIAGTENEDEFEVTLQVGTTMKAIPNDAAVVLVMDASGSMLTDAGGKMWGNWGNMPTDGRKLRIDFLREAALEFAEDFAEDAGASKRMLAMVEFGNNAYTCLPWTNINDDGTLHEDAKAAIESVDVSFVYDNRRFWDEEKMLSTYLSPAPDTEKVQQKVDYWSDVEYVHETKSYYQAFFESYYGSFMVEYTTTMVTKTVEDTEVTRCTYDGCTEAGLHTHCTVEGCIYHVTHSHCTYEGCTETAAHTHCTYEGCQSTVADHKHCTVCGVTDAKAPADTHCTYEGCTKTEEHSHCTYSICKNPEGHEHCERVCWCDEDHEHCEDIMAVCGRTDEHTHVTGCTMTGCQDTTPYHKHACTHGSEGDYPYCDMHGGYYNIERARCLNSDPYHTHDVYDGDTAYTILDRDWQKYFAVGTNMEGGLLLARNLLNSGLADGGAIEGIDDVYVIILSDGNPTWHVDQSVETTADTEVRFIRGQRGTRDCDWADICDIVYDEQATDLVSDTAFAEDIKAMADFYAVLYGTELSSRLGGTHSMSSVTGAEWFNNKNDLSAEPEVRNYIGADLVLESPEINGLSDVFSNLNDRIDVLAKAWTVTDALSDDVTFGEFLLNGEFAGYAPAAEDKEASVSWSLGSMEPDNPNAAGGVKDPFVYTLKYKVKLNSAQDNVKKTSLDHDKNPALEGVWTGKSANLKYFMVEKNALDNMSAAEIARMTKDAAFEDVSVKGIYGGLSFIKKNGETDQPIEGVGFTLYNSEGKAYGEELFSDSEGKVVFTNVPRGSYTLKETTVPEGLEEMAVLGLLESWGNVTGNDGSAIPAVIYNYKPAENPGPGPGTNPGPSVTPDTKPDDTPIDDPDVPMGGEPEVEIPDEEVPKADAPKTGDASVLWLAMTALSGAGLFVTRRKKED